MIELSLGVTLANRYTIEAVLGRGSVAYTYRASDQQSGIPVALKVMDLSSVRDWKVVELFEREARILRGIRHDRIPACIDSFQTEYEETRLFCIAQTLAAGENLEEAIAAGWDPDEPEVRRMALELLRLVEYLHGLKPRVVHRDIKPHNIVRDSYGRLSLVDFGSVQAHFPEAYTGSTVVGTPGYMPPEQSIGRADPASDLYSLGMTLVFLLTKVPPHSLPRRGMRADFRQRAIVSPTFARWLDQMIAPSVEHRFRTATQAREALDKPPRRWLPLAGIAAGTAGIALFGAGLAGWLGPDDPLAAAAEVSTTERSSPIASAAVGVFSTAPPSSRPSSFLPTFGAIDQVGVRRQELVLDAIPTEVDLGRNGEVLAMLIRDRNEVRLVDLVKRTPICSVALGSADVKVAAGADRVVIAGTTSDDVRIYDYECRLQRGQPRPSTLRTWLSLAAITRISFPRALEGFA